MVMAHLSDITVGGTYTQEPQAQTGITSPPQGLSWRIKLVMDLAGSAVLLIVFAPVLLGIALAVRFTSPGPVFFRQPRFGAGKQPVIVTKFRTMRVDGTDMGGKRQATRDDNRITPVGRFLRRTCLDELPQLWDVLCGRMSLVGPRPHPLELEIDGTPVEELIPNYHARHAVRPGMTGLAQINGNRGPVADYRMAAERVSYDTQYIREHSLWRDVTLLIKTLAVPFQKDGSY